MRRDSNPQPPREDRGAHPVAPRTDESGCPARIRTSIHRSRGGGPAVERRGNIYKLVSPVRFERTSSGLEDRRIILSATARVVGPSGVEPETRGSEPHGCIPQRADKHLVEAARLELALPGCKPGVFPLDDAPGVACRIRTGVRRFAGVCVSVSANATKHWSERRESNPRQKSGTLRPSH